MDNQLSQLITLVNYYNSGEHHLDLTISNPVFADCHPLRFLIFKKKFFRGYKEVAFADNTISWFQSLKKNGCRKLLLTFETEDEHSYRYLIKNPSNWYIRAVHSHYSDYWKAHWTLNEKSFSEGGPRWHVSYQLSMPNADPWRLPRHCIASEHEKLCLALSGFLTSINVQNSSGKWAAKLREIAQKMEKGQVPLHLLQHLTPKHHLQVKNARLLVLAIQCYQLLEELPFDQLNKTCHPLFKRKQSLALSRLNKAIVSSILASVNPAADREQPTTVIKGEKRPVAGNRLLIRA